jgi:hypothetical protein
LYCISFRTNTTWIHPWEETFLIKFLKQFVEFGTKGVYRMMYPHSLFCFWNTSWRPSPQIK